MKPTSETKINGGPEDDSSNAPSSEPVGLTAFPSVAQFDLEHNKLLAAQGESEDDAQLVDEVESFIIRGRLLGVTLEDASVRQDCQSILNYWAIFAYRTRRNRLDATLRTFDPNSAPALDDSQFPYRFTEEMDDAAQEMLGWRRLLDECERDLAGDHLLTVMGEADAGAYFLIHNLLVPRLRSGQARLQALSGSEQWRYYEVPLGSDPITDLLQAIASQEGHDPEWVARQKTGFGHDQTTLRRILEADSELPAVFVFSRFVAVLECSDSDHQAFVNNLAHLLQNPQRRFYVIVTLNRDRSIPLSSFGPLEKPLRDGHVRLAFTMAELRHLVEEPARRVGLIFETGLIDQILISIQGEPAALPLLRFTLERLWKLRQRNRITWQAFEKTGAGRTALSNALDAIHSELTEPEQEVLRQIFLSMVRLEPSGSFTAGEVTQEDLYRTSYNTTRVKEVLERLRSSGLIHEVSLDGSPSYTLTHSAMLISWPPLVDWLDDFRDNQRLRLRLRDAAHQWKSGGMHKDLLWQGKVLAAANETFETDSSLATLEQNFLHASQTRAARKKWTQRLLYGAVVSAVLLVIGVVAYQRNAAENARQSQQMLGEAMEHLAKGDLAAALLWLEHRDKTFGESSGDKHETERVEMLRKLAGSQLPRLGPLAFSSIQYDYKQEYGFKRVAVSPDYKYVAAIHLRNPQTTEGSSPKKDSLLNQVSLSRNASQPKRDKGPFCLTIRSLDFPVRSDDPPITSTSQTANDWPALELDFPVPPPADASSQVVSPNDGAVAFVSLAPHGDEPEYYLLASAGGLHAWKVPQLDASRQPKPDDWKSVTIEPKRETEKALSGAIVSIVAGGQGWVLTIQQVGVERRLRLWRVAKGSDSNSIVLNSALLPKGLESANVQMAHLSAKGDLLAISDDQGESELQVWTRTQPGQRGMWKRTSPPAWVTDLQSKDPQRIHDWGWSLKEVASSQPPQTSIWVRKGTAIRRACFSPSGERFVTACDDGQVLVWGFSSPRTDLDGASAIYIAPLLETELQLGSTVFDVTFLSENVLVTGGRDRTARVWDIHSATEIATRTVHEGTVNQVVVAGADKLLTNTSAVLRIWTSEDYGLPKAPSLDGRITSSGDGRRMLHILPDSASGTPLVVKIRNWAAPSQLVWQLRLPKDLQKSPAIAMSDAGDLLAAATRETEKEETDPNLFLWTTTRKEEASSDVDLLSQYSVRIPSRITSSETTGSPRKLAFRELAFGRYRGQDLLAIVGEEQDDSGKKRGLIFFGIPDARAKDPELVLYAVTVPNQENLYPHQEAVKCVLFSDSGELLVTGDQNDKAKTWNVADLVKSVRELELKDNTEGGKVIQATPVDELNHSSDVVDLCFSPETTVGTARLLATVSSEGEASVWTVNANVTAAKATATPEPKYILQHDANILTVSFSPNGQWIVTGGKDRAVRVWHSAEGKLAGIFRHAGAVEYAALLENDRLITASQSSIVDNPEQPPVLQIRERNLANALPMNQGELKKLAAQEMNEDGQLRRLNVDKYREVVRSASDNQR